MTTSTTDTSTTPPTFLTAAHRALDQVAIRKYGPHRAVLRSPSVDTAVRRAGTVLFRDDITADELVTVLGMWSLLNGGRAA